MDSIKAPTIDLSRLIISPDLLKLLSREVMKKHRVLPFDLTGNRLSVALADPADAGLIAQLQMMAGHEVEAFSASGDQILQVLDRFFPEEPKPYSKDLDISVDNTEMPTSKIVDKIFEMALQARASDIHLEPQIDGLFARFRVDGVLQTIHEFNKTVSLSIASRVKVLAGMDIAEKRLPQDGQIVVSLLGREIDLRVSTLPGKYGEKVVIRLLDKSNGTFDMGELGMDPVNQSRFEMMIDKPQGLLLVTGPTGSGKTTTLYSVLNRLKSPLKNIVTLENPIEYELLAGCSNESGITQVQINPKIGLTFATGLRAALRQDPDVIMVGEIRDKETAEVSMKAALTGHLVLSTLHTNDAPSAITRLHDIGVEPYLIPSTVTGVLAQRLLRLLCADCKEPYEPPERAFKSWFPNHKSETKLTLYRPKGCAKCHGTGYWGRKGIFELLVMTDELKQILQENASIETIRNLAKSQGLKTVRDSGLDLVYLGLTTAEEVFRNTVA